MSTIKSPSNTSKPPLAVIAGPTASGKSDLAVTLAEKLSAQGRRAAVINCDSAQVYRDLKVLSARPDESEMRGVPHYLFGEWDGAAPCSAADWASAAKETIAKLHETSTVPILVGGTGLYIRTLLDGISPIPPIDPEIRAAIRKMQQKDARAALETEDPEAAARLAPADTTRTMRALEIIRSTGKPISSWHGNPVGGIAAEVDLHPLVLIPDRQELYDRCDRRFVQMLSGGAMEEVEKLLQRKLDPALPVMRAIGVREIAALITGETERDEAIAAGQLSTRQYAKRQFTWFRNQTPEDWPQVNNKNADIDEIFEIILPK